MLCKRCFGTGKCRKWLFLLSGGMFLELPCPDCQGSGVTSCCEVHDPKGEEKTDGN